VVSPYVRGEFSDPKSEESGRSVPLAKRIADALADLRKRTLYPADGDLVFCHPETGHPLDRSKLVRRFKSALDRAEARRITSHELRHTFGTRWRQVACLCARSSIGWATQTQRPLRSTRTTSHQMPRLTPWTTPLNDSSAWTMPGRAKAVR
jgi:integrase